MNWQIIIRKHRLADSPEREGLPREVVDLVADGEVIATVAPVDSYGPAIQITTPHLDLSDAHVIMVDDRESIVFGPPGANAQLREALFTAAGLSEKEKLH